MPERKELEVESLILLPIFLRKCLIISQKTTPFSPKLYLTKNAVLS